MAPKERQPAAPRQIEASRREATPRLLTGRSKPGSLSQLARYSAVGRRSVGVEKVNCGKITDLVNRRSVVVTLVGVPGSITVLARPLLGQRRFECSIVKATAPLIQGGGMPGKTRRVIRVFPYSRQRRRQFLTSADLEAFPLEQRRLGLSVCSIFRHSVVCSKSGAEFPNGLLEVAT